MAETLVCILCTYYMYTFITKIKLLLGYRQYEDDIGVLVAVYFLHLFVLREY
ncbi:hypothetical protein B0T09DRAFT_329831 [Sordaria sp. MPI-SDFR-AT-0083]|nr:hypothetical protein B0T09DRAFT_329831 [Sordaria sp. MPI-SDFR-AT-0083]